MIKAIKGFRIYILHSHVIEFVPNTVVKEILTQADPDGKRGKWIATILENYLEIKPTILIKGQGLAKLMAESNCEALDINFIAELDNEEEMVTPQISHPFTDSPWYANIIYILQNRQDPLELSRTKGRFLKMKSLKSCIIKNALFWENHKGILLNCLLKEESDKIL